MRFTRQRCGNTCRPPGLNELDLQSFSAKEAPILSYKEINRADAAAGKGKHHALERRGQSAALHYHNYFPKYESHQQARSHGEKPTLLRGTDLLRTPGDHGSH